jgi:hypothetical protein
MREARLGSITDGTTRALENNRIQAVPHRGDNGNIHGAQFEPSKYVLVHFTRNKNLEYTASITINGTKIEPSSEVKYLGVIFDQKLRFHSYLQRVIKMEPTQRWHYLV